MTDLSVWVVAEGRSRSGLYWSLSRILEAYVVYIICHVQCHDIIFIFIFLNDHDDQYDDHGDSTKASGIVPGRSNQRCDLQRCKLLIYRCRVPTVRVVVLRGFSLKTAWDAMARRRSHSRPLNTVGLIMLQNVEKDELYSPNVSTTVGM